MANTVTRPFRTFVVKGIEPMTVDQIKMNKDFDRLHRKYLSANKQSYTQELDDLLDNLMKIVESDRTAPQTTRRALTLLNEAFSAFTVPQEVCDDFSHRVQQISSKKGIWSDTFRLLGTIQANHNRFRQDTFPSSTSPASQSQSTLL